MKNVRIQLEMSEAKVKDIEFLMEEHGIRTRKELFNNALTLLAWGITEVKSGRIIVSVKEKGSVIKELIMPWMLHIRKNQHS